MWGEGREEVELEIEKERKRINTEPRDMKHPGQGQGLGRVQGSVEGKPSTSSLILPYTHTQDLKHFRPPPAQGNVAQRRSHAIDCIPQTSFEHCKVPST